MAQAVPAAEDENYKSFLEKDLSDYEGEWIAISDGDVIAHDENERLVRQLAREKVGRDVLITKVPDPNSVLIL